MIDTACSSSLVAVHDACRAIVDGECDMALAGGVNLILNLPASKALYQAGFLSPDCKCKVSAVLLSLWFGLLILLGTSLLVFGYICAGVQ